MAGEEGRMMDKVINKPQFKDLFRSATIYLVAGLFIFSTTFSINIDSLSAANLTDLYKQQSSASTVIRQSTAAAQAKKAEADKLAQDVKKIDSDISAIQAKINETQSQIDETEKSILETENQIKQKEEELKIQIGNRNEAIKVIYENSRTNTFEVVLGSDNLSDVINHNEYIDALEQKIESTIDEINKLKKEMEQKKSDLETRREELNKLADQQTAYKQGLASQQKQKSVLLGDAKSQQKDYEKQVAEAKKLESQVQAEIAKTIAAQNSSSSGGVSARDKGTSAVGFMWPMDYKYISCYFGESSPFQASHTGIDLANTIGTPIYAASDGTVIFAGTSPLGESVGYGRYVIIGHNARYSTLYGHMMSYNISVGQEVKRGQTIGYEGNTGWSTGPHLHFEVREYGSAMNPMNYLP